MTEQQATNKAKSTLAIGVRFTAADVARLDAIAEALARTQEIPVEVSRSDVVRNLTIRGLPAIEAKLGIAPPAAPEGSTKGNRKSARASARAAAETHVEPAAPPEAPAVEPAAAPKRKGKAPAAAAPEAPAKAPGKAKRTRAPAAPVEPAAPPEAPAVEPAHVEPAAAE